MKEGRIFLYVSPNVIIPIMFLVLVLTSLSVHYSVLTNTTWFGDFFQGSATAVVEMATETEAAAPVADAMAPAAEAAAPAEGGVAAAE
jgi:light-harvesting protein B-800-850 alpha chain